MARERLVVIGGDAGGMSAASQARRLRSADELEIVAFEKGKFTSYSACGIPYVVAGDVESLDRLVVRTPAEFAAKNQIDVHIDSEVTAIDLDRRAVQVNGDVWEPFDQLMIATGAKPVRPDLPGLDAENVHGVQTLDDGAAVMRSLEQRKPRTAVVVGSGYIGLEMAEAMVKRGLDVTLIERGAQPMSTLDPDMGALLNDAIRGLGIDLRINTEVEAFEDGAVVTDAGRVDADLVVLGIGVRPNVALAEEAGIPIGPAGGVAVDRRQRAGGEGIWSAGDCCESFHRISRRPVVIALGTHANKQGRVAGVNIGGGYAAFAGVVGTAVSKICAVEVARTGLGEGEARAAGFEAVATKVESTTRAGYFPGTAPLTVKVIAERGGGRLLGAQIVGKEGAAKRIDVFACALWNEMTVEQVLGMDLSYAPPFAPVWDPVLIAARKSWEIVQASGYGEAR